MSGGSSCMTWLTRLRHRRGFGVHSPFAYTLIREVISPRRRYSYYAEEETDNPHEIRAIRLAALIGRIRASRPGEIRGCEYIIGPTAEETERLHRTLRSRGGLLLIGREYLIAVARPDMKYRCYLI